MSGKPKRHHTVPKFYLQEFAAGTRLKAVNVQTGREHTTNVADATVESNFYTVPDHPTDRTSFEAALSQAEGAAAGIFRSIIAGQWPLEPADRESFAEFMTLQFLRVQSHRSQMHHVIAAELHALAVDDPDELARILALPGAPVGFDIANSETLPLVSSAVHIQQISTLIPQLVGHLLGRPWELIRFDDPSLITSDEPLTPLTNPAEVQSVGLGLENSWALIFPVTRRIALVMFRDPLRNQEMGIAHDIGKGHFDMSRQGDDETRQLFNTNTVMHANRYVLHHPADRHLVPEHVVELSKHGGRINVEDIPEGLRPTP